MAANHDSVDPSALAAEGGFVMIDRTLSVPDISCAHCKTSIEGAVGPIEGVESVEVAIDDRTVAIGYDGDDDTFQSIVAAIEDQGYEVADERAIEDEQRGPVNQ